MLKDNFYIILFLLFSFGIQAQGVSVSPPRLFFSGNPGETIQLPLIFDNSADTDYVFEAHLKDWNRDIQGEKIYFKESSLEASNASWISLEENTIQIPARTSKEILVTLKIPLEASSEAVTNSMLFFTQIKKTEDVQEQKMGLGIITLLEFGIHIYYTPAKNSNRSLDIVGIDLIEEQRQMKVSIENDGNLVNDASVDLELTHLETGEEIFLPSRPVSMMPEALQEVSFHLPEHLKGSYLAVVIVRMAGTKDLRVGEKRIEL